jgi:hypothetical protein
LAIDKATVDIKNNKRENSKIIVVLATDGLPTDKYGIQNKYALKLTELAAIKLKQISNLTLVVIKIGRFSDNFLKNISDEIIGVNGFSELDGILSTSKILCG